MKERPILFSATMVRAILDGRKTQTRRVVKPQPPSAVTSATMVACPAHGGSAVVWRGKDHIDPLNGTEFDSSYKARNPNGWSCPYGQPGDRLWVREAFSHFERNDTAKPGCTIYYRADGQCVDLEPWRPSIHMPRWASRITLEITGVRVERLQDISDDDALAEGVDRTNTSIPGYATERYRKLWESINGRDSWAANPWVWVVAFKLVKP